MIVLPDHPFDKALFGALPLALIPRKGTLDALPIGGTRLLAASDGVYIEARTRVLHACGRLALIPGLPYGSIRANVNRLIDADPQPLLTLALEAASRECPNEWAGAILWRDNQLYLHQPVLNEQSPSRVSYSTSDIDALDLLWDIHSHGDHDAYFSETDNADDCACPTPCFLASVIGRARSSQPTWATRLIIAGRAFDPYNPIDSIHLAFPSPREKLAA